MGSSISPSVTGGPESEASCGSIIDVVAEFGEQIPKLGRFWSDSEAESAVEDRKITGVCPGDGSSRGDEIEETGGVEGPGGAV